jgi:hypothetical protein
MQVLVARIRGRGCVTGLKKVFRQGGQAGGDLKAVMERVGCGAYGPVAPAAFLLQTAVQFLRGALAGLFYFIE